MKQLCSHLWTTLITLICISSFAASTSFAALSVTQYGITWYFDQEYEVGQFVNGDWWVIGPVTITSISPDYTGTRHGWEVNPSSIDQTTGYDDRVQFSASLVPSLPYMAQPGDSVVKIVSNPDTQDCSGGWTTWTGQCSRSPLQTAAVLTIVGESVPEGTFRPPYVGTWKPFTYSYRNVRTHLLKNLSHVAGTPTFSSLERHVERLQLDDIVNWTSRYIHPTENFATGYGANITARYAEIVLRLNMDDPIEDKRLLLIHFLQAGIDYYGMLREGHTWPPNGGHDAGRKLPIFFAGYLFNDADMFNIGTQYPASTNTFQDDSQFFYTFENPPFANAPNPGCYAPLPTDYLTAQGYARYGIRHHAGPTNTLYNGEDSICEGTYSSYWGLNVGSQRGTAIAVEVLGLMDEWGAGAIFDFFHRMAGVPTAEVWGSAFNNTMYSTYHGTFDDATATRFPWPMFMPAIKKEQQ